MHVNLECSARKHKFARASNFENHLNVVIKNKQTVIFIKQRSLNAKTGYFWFEPQGERPTNSLSL